MRVSWRWSVAAVLFFCAFFGFLTGVGLSERPDVHAADALTKAYYSLGLFVMGGLDLGTPQGGPLFSRTLLWISYFGSPILAASTIIEAVVKTLSPHTWRFQRFRNHVIVAGSGELAVSFVKEFRRVSPSANLLIIDNDFDQLREIEFRRRYHAKIVRGDITRSFFLQRLHLKCAKKVILLGDDNFQNYEAAHKILDLEPKLQNNIIIHCNSIRFMRSMADSYVAKQCINFNAYQLAASALVKKHLNTHFLETTPKDVVVIAGFGVFGQTILEELQYSAKEEIDTIAIIGVDAKRRIQVVDEQNNLTNFCRREVFEGPISHPQVWKELRTNVDLKDSQPVIILCTDSEEDNFRTSLWIKRKYPGAMVIARSYLPSKFATAVSEQNDILNVSINKLVRENFPADWLDVSDKRGG